MNRPRFALILGFFAAFLIHALPARAGEPLGRDSRSAVVRRATVRDAAAVVHGFFDAFGKGDVEGAINAFDLKALITAVRKEPRKGDQLYGSYSGKEGVREFFTNLAKTFDTKAFSVDHVVGDGVVAYANGSFSHIVKATSKPYISDWALMCVVREGKILEYHFFEDSAGFEKASL
jgi:ketosteroid isomerase-like protein